MITVLLPSAMCRTLSLPLAKLVKDADTGDYKDYMHLLAAGGFKDTTRIAASSPEMWEQICAANGFGYFTAFRGIYQLSYCSQRTY